MKAQLLTEESGPAGLALTEIADPIPGPGQLLVDIKSCGVCFPDLLIAQGKYQIRPPLPFIPGTEVSGVVREAPDGGQYRPGDKVLVTPMIGGFAEQILVVPEMLLPMPEGLSFDEGAALGINFQTAVFALKMRAQTAPGEVVAAARQYVRKVSGIRHPSAATEVAFEEAVATVAAATRDLLGVLPQRRQPPRTVPPLRRPEVIARLGR